MGDTPKHYIQILDLVTALKVPSERELGALEARQLGRLRKAFADRNMVAVGVSEKVYERRDSGRLSVCFYVEKKISRSKLGRGKMLPEVIFAPDGQAVFTDVKVVGKVRPQINKKSNPCQSGFSVAHKDLTLGTGTVGAIVRKGNSRYILSNLHVLAKSGTASVGDAILYPGKLDGGVPGVDDIATLSAFNKFIPGLGYKNLYDAALAKILPSRLQDVELEIRGVVGTAETMAPARGMTVCIRGRTSGDDEAQIVDIDIRKKLTYDELAAPITFKNQVLCKRYSWGGDSGALVVAKDFGKIVGLHFSGSSISSWFSPIEPIMTELGIQFVAAGME